LTHLAFLYAEPSEQPWNEKEVIIRCSRKKPILSSSSRFAAAQLMR